MANPEHVAKLMEGVEAWNTWLRTKREGKLSDEEDYFRPDLSEADLSRTTLSKTDLSGNYLFPGVILSKAIVSKADGSEAHSVKFPIPKVILSGADLSKANLSNANLSETNLSEANLKEAILSEANLSGAYLSEANLSGAYLSKADLSGTHLVRVDLSNANLRRANLSGAFLTGANLSGAFLVEADLTRATLNFVVLREATLNHANLKGTFLAGADLREAQIVAVQWDPGRMGGGRYRGIRGIESCFGNALFERAVKDEEFLIALEDHWRHTWRRHLFRAWGLIDYGRSLPRVAYIASGLVFLYGLIYSIWPSLLNYGPDARDWFTPFYFSIVTYTTLGFGDINPKGHWIGEVIVSSEVILGYTTLGLLLAVLAEKIARRS